MSEEASGLIAEVPGQTGPGTGRLRSFIGAFALLVGETLDSRRIRENGAELLRQLVAQDDWLPDMFARPDPGGYAQYLLHCDSLERFSVVSFVWGPGQGTPVHDHRVWGLVGVLRGVERVRHFDRHPDGALLPIGEAVLLQRGEVEAFEPGMGDIHQVSNGVADGSSVSIHVYGGNIAAVARATYDEAGREKPFISRYANDLLPNLWNAPL